MLGSTVYRNSLSPSLEPLSSNFYTLPSLIMPGTTHVLATSFNRPSPSYLRRTFASVSNLLVIQDDSKTTFAHQIGDQHLTPIQSPLQSDEDLWHYLFLKPNTGIQHAKLTLLRSPAGLRVIIAGSNLGEQWSVDRDVFWCQDFPHLPPGVRPASPKRKSNTFQEDLVAFLRHFNLSTSTTSDNRYGWS